MSANEGQELSNISYMQFKRSSITRTPIFYGFYLFQIKCAKAICKAQL